jgi:hypothetical protein
MNDTERAVSAKRQRLPHRWRTVLMILGESRPHELPRSSLMNRYVEVGDNGGGRSGSRVNYARRGFSRVIDDMHAAGLVKKTSWMTKGDDDRRSAAVELTASGAIWAETFFRRSNRPSLSVPWGGVTSRPPAPSNRAG